ncbi:hypothetical protein H5410_029670 [Solanum commersonii]|uniref:Uncharacterized protein n=1 Tax=Solanum commersonii TaxID=4109 RepID=A0A9J5YGD0_SOLCO|nr:hypothetical protein H5410_029670 [Solanum commersonii]
MGLTQREFRLAPMHVLDTGWDTKKEKNLLQYHCTHEEENLAPFEPESPSKITSTFTSPLPGP